MTGGKFSLLHPKPPGSFSPVFVDPALWGDTGCSHIEGVLKKNIFFLEKPSKKKLGGNLTLLGYLAQRKKK